MGAGGKKTDINALDTPLPDHNRNLIWALLNLILTAAGAVLIVLLILRTLVHRKRDKEDEEQDEDIEEARLKALAAYGEYEDGREKRKRRRFRPLLIIAVPLLEIIAIILFLLTQDMSLQMVLIDWWTIAHLVIFIAVVLCYIYSIRHRHESYDYEDIIYYTDDDRHFP